MPEKLFFSFRYILELYCGQHLIILCEIANAFAGFPTGIKDIANKKKLVKEKRGRALIPSPSNAYNVNKSIVGERSFSEMVTKQLLFMVML